MSAIRIVSIPPGEAPEHIRAAWVGLVLPLFVDALQVTEGAGVLSGPKSRLGWFFARLRGKTTEDVGYLVEADQAVEILSHHDPEAAMWWRENVAWVNRPGMTFLFAAGACQEVA